MRANFNTEEPQLYKETNFCYLRYIPVSCSFLASDILLCGAFPLISVEFERGPEAILCLHFFAAGEKSVGMGISACLNVCGKVTIYFANSLVASWKGVVIMKNSVLSYKSEDIESYIQYWAQSILFKVCRSLKVDILCALG